MTEPILDVKHLCVCYDDFVAVEDASLTIFPGQIVSLIGLNGAGKTTLVHTLAGLLRPTEGQIYFQGEAITGLSTEKIVNRGLSLVMQGGHCFQRMSVQDNLLMGSFPRHTRAEAKKTLDYIYELFPVLEEKKNSMAGTLSGGQRQMVAIGRALMAQPKFLIFDELSIGLAPNVIKDLYQRILEINAREHTTFLLIEQDTQRALKVSERYYVMLKGKTVMSGKSESVNLTELKQAYFGITE